MLLGSGRFLICFMTFKASPSCLPIYGDFAIPMPCSADTVPWRAECHVNESRAMFLTVFHCSGTAGFMMKVAWRLPSPMWPKVATGKPYFFRFVELPLWSRGMRLMAHRSLPLRGRAYTPGCSRLIAGTRAPRAANSFAFSTGLSDQIFSIPPTSLQISSIAFICSLTALFGPSMPMKSWQLTSLGISILSASLHTSRQMLSRISQVASSRPEVKNLFYGLARGVHIGKRGFGKSFILRHGQKF